MMLRSWSFWLGKRKIGTLTSASCAHSHHWSIVASMILATGRFAVFNLRPLPTLVPFLYDKSAIQAFKTSGPNHAPLDRVSTIRVTG